MKLSRKPHPTWSLVTSFWGAILIFLLSALIVFLPLRKPVWAELEFTMLLVSVITFLFYFYILYHGVQFDRNEQYTITRKPVELPSWLDCLNVGVPDLDIDFGDGFFAGLLGVIVFFLVLIFLAVALSVLIWLGANLIMIGLPVLFFPLYMVFRRSVRYVVAKGRRCFGQVFPSALFALRATAVNMGWVYIVIYLAHRISVHIANAHQQS